MFLNVDMDDVIFVELPAKSQIVSSTGGRSEDEVSNRLLVIKERDSFV